MNERVYVASGLQNYRAVLDLQERLRREGFIITFNWAGFYHHQTELGLTLDGDQKRRLAEEMARGVVRADCLLLLMPGKRGAHVELGIAHGAGRSAIVVCPDPADDISFYSLPRVLLVRDVDAAVHHLHRRVGRAAEEG